MDVLKDFANLCSLLTAKNVEFPNKLASGRAKDRADVEALERRSRR